MPTIDALTPQAFTGAIPALADILIDCVHGGASVSFQPPLTTARATAFWSGLTADVERGATQVLVARHNDEIVGTVQLQYAQQDNQPHRADIAKMLVHTKARRLGLGAALMIAAEHEAQRAQRTLLCLDTTTGSHAERLYRRLGWTRVGEIPGFSLTPYDGIKATTIFYKQIA
jgi:GNAT superfamily N-acetyltransferase